MWNCSLKTLRVLRPPVRIDGLSLALLILVPLFTAQAVAAQHLHPRLRSRERTLHTILILPPRVNIQKEGMRGSESMIKESDDVGAVIADVVSVALREKLLNVVGEQTSASVGTDGSESLYVLADMQNRYDKLWQLINNKPKDVTKGRFSLGDEVSVLDPDSKTDAMIFIRASGIKLTNGKKLYGKLVPGARLRSTITVWLALVDSKSGEVLYFVKFDAKGDFVDNTSQVLLESLRKALRELPAAAPHGGID